MNDKKMNDTKIPQLVTSLPGPKAKASVDLDVRYVSPSLPRAYPLVVKQARGVAVEDVDGNVFLDCMAGIAVCSTGHCHPRVVNAIQDQAARLLHICAADTYDPMYTRLAQRLSQLAPCKGNTRVFLGNSGSEAVEAAIKLSRNHSGRPLFLAFLGAFHGRTMGSASLTASKATYRRGYEPLLPGITHIPYAYCYRCAYNLTYPSCDLACVKFIENQLFPRTVPPDRVAAIFVEPIQGEGGYVVPPEGWLARIREMCDKHGILLVDDEVQSGIGRTGKMFAIEHWGIEPDLICSAKGLGSGMPISAMIAKEEVMTWPKGSHGSTFGGNPVGCAAALATLDVIEEENLMENATRVGARLKDNLEQIAKDSRLIGDVRGLGLMIGVELVKDKSTKEMAKLEVDQVVDGCFQEGLLVLGCGPNSIRFSPPLVLTEQQADTACDIFARVLYKVEGRNE